MPLRDSGIYCHACGRSQTLSHPSSCLFLFFLFTCHRFFSFRNWQQCPPPPARFANQSRGSSVIFPDPAPAPLPWPTLSIFGLSNFLFLLIIIILIEVKIYLIKKNGGLCLKACMVRQTATWKMNFFTPLFQLHQPPILIIIYASCRHILIMIRNYQNSPPLEQGSFVNSYFESAITFSSPSLVKRSKLSLQVSRIISPLIKLLLQELINHILAN